MDALKHTIKQLVPPALVSVRNRLRPAEKVFGSYAEALRECECFESSLYLDLIHEKTKNYLQQLDAAEFEIFGSPPVSNNLCVLQAAMKDGQLRVADFGGACGIHYFQFKKFAKTFDLPLKQLRWHVIETEGMVQKASHFGNEELHFATNLEALPTTPDVIFSSSTLQYLPNPFDQLKKFVEMAPELIYLARTCLSHLDHNLVTIQTTNLTQNGAGPVPAGFTDRLLSWPHTTISQALLEKLFARNYRLVARFDDFSSVLPLKRCATFGGGYVYQKRSS